MRGGGVRATVAVNIAGVGVDFRAIFGRRKDQAAAGLSDTARSSAGLSFYS